LKKNGIVPDSLKQFTTIQIPIVVTSTSHPFIEMLGVENTLVLSPIPIIFLPKNRKQVMRDWLEKWEKSKYRVLLIFRN
jgi:iron complex transport system substrate-binding protein